MNVFFFNFWRVHIQFMFMCIIVFPFFNWSYYQNLICVYVVVSSWNAMNEKSCFHNLPCSPLCYLCRSVFFYNMQCMYCVFKYAISICHGCIPSRLKLKWAVMQIQSGFKTFRCKNTFMSTRDTAQIRWLSL